MQLKIIFPFLFLNLLPFYILEGQHIVEAKGYQKEGYLFCIGIYSNTDTTKYPCIGILGFQPCSDSTIFLLDALNHEAGRLGSVPPFVPLIPPFGHEITIDSIQSLYPDFPKIIRLNGKESTFPCYGKKTDYTLKLYYLYCKISYEWDNNPYLQVTENIYCQNQVYSFYNHNTYYINEFYPIKYEKETIDFWNKTVQKEPKYWLDYKKNQQKDENNKVK